MRILWSLFFVLNMVAVSAQDWTQFGWPGYEILRSYYGDTLNNDLYITGHFRYFNDSLDARGIVKWDGEEFTTLGTFPNAQCNDYNCNPVIAITGFQEDIYCSLLNGWADPGEIYGIARWDGEQWDSVSTQIDGFVKGLYVYDNKLLVMGALDHIGGEEVHGVMAWNGTDWESMNFPYYASGFSTVLTALEYNGDLYVGGNFASDDGSERDIARYDGETWSIVGGGVKGGADDVGSIVEYKGELYIGGDFHTGSGNAGNCIMKLENEEWVAVGGSFDTPYSIVTSMLVYQDKLYVFGTFPSVGGGVPAKNIAVWDGESWCGTGAEINSKIGNAIIFNDDLFIRGSFMEIDGEPIIKSARWSNLGYLDTCGSFLVSTPELPKEVLNLTLSPNPAMSEVKVSWPNTPSGMQLILYNTIGQPILKQSFREELIINVSNYPSGIYLAHFQNVEGTLGTRKLIVE